MNWWTSDTHFGHNRILSLCPERKFASVEEMDAAMIATWNSYVKPGDYVFHLGDLALCSSGRLRQILKQLNGNIFLKMGNHDHKSARWYRSAGIISVSQGNSFYTFTGGDTVSYSHFPLYPTFWELCGMLLTEPHHLRYLPKLPPRHPGWHICGHVHNLWTRKGKQINVGWDCWKRPVAESEIITIIKTHEK